MNVPVIEEHLFEAVRNVASHQVCFIPSMHPRKISTLHIYLCSHIALSCVQLEPLIRNVLPLMYLQLPKSLTINEIFCSSQYTAKICVFIMLKNNINRIVVSQKHSIKFGEQNRCRKFKMQWSRVKLEHGSNRYRGHARKFNLTKMHM